MHLPVQVAKQIRDFHFDGNWTAVNLKDTLADISWQEATTPVYSFNTIAALVFHMNYYVSAVIKVLEGNPLDAHDKFSFDHPPIRSQDDWGKLLDKTWKDAENFAALVEQLPENIFGDDFSDNKYGTYHRNIEGVIEHLHYHLGQIVLIKKILRNSDSN